MDVYAAVRYLDGTKQIFQVCNYNGIEDAFATLKRDVPNTRAILVSVPCGKRAKDMEIAA